MDLPDPGIKAESPALQVDSLPAELHGKPSLSYSYRKLETGAETLCPESNESQIKTAQGGSCDAG